MLLTLDAWGNLGPTVFIIHTADLRGQVVPIETLIDYSKHVNPAQAHELLNIVKQYRAERAGLRGRA